MSALTRRGAKALIAALSCLAIVGIWFLPEAAAAYARWTLVLAMIACGEGNIHSGSGGYGALYLWVALLGLTLAILPLVPLLIRAVLRRLWKDEERG